MRSQSQGQITDNNTNVRYTFHLPLIRQHGLILVARMLKIKAKEITEEYS
jgi:hypothetical protein